MTIDYLNRAFKSIQNKAINTGIDADMRIFQYSLENKYILLSIGGA